MNALNILQPHPPKVTTPHRMQTGPAHALPATTCADMLTSCSDDGHHPRSASQCLHHTARLRLQAQWHSSLLSARHLQLWQQPAALCLLPLRPNNALNTRCITVSLHGAPWLLLSGRTHAAGGHWQQRGSCMQTKPNRAPGSTRHCVRLDRRPSTDCGFALLCSISLVLHHPQNMQALPCPKGSYKNSVSRATSCSPCPAGLSTVDIAATDSSACNVAQPGYEPVVDNGTVTTVLPCPVGSYSSDGMQCVNCSDGLTTQSAASTSATDCTAPPGYGYYKDGLGDNNPVTTADLQSFQQKVVRCPAGSWKVLCWLAVFGCQGKQPVPESCCAPCMQVSTSDTCCLTYLPFLLLLQQCAGRMEPGALQVMRRQHVH